MFQEQKETADYISRLIPCKPYAGIVLGTGLGGLTREILDQVIISYHDIPNFPEPTVKGHAGQLIFGILSGKPVLAMNGRFHYYEGYSLQEVTFPVRVLKMLGIELLILSNASGGLNPGFSIGDIMLVEDHINLLPSNPLTGTNHDHLGPRFPDMSKPYDPQMISKVKTIAAHLGLSIRHGVYAGVTGPTFETPAEYRYIRSIGADAVGMSTVPEVIVANHMGLPVLAFSIISDLGVEGKIVKISHEEVIDAASLAEPNMTVIIKELLASVN